MKERKKPGRLVPMPDVEKEPELADQLDTVESSRCFLSVKRNSYSTDFADSVGRLHAINGASELEPPKADRPVKIISYYGSLSDRVGNDGDFYVDEMTNMLYGPKTKGVWPEEGANANGLCKRTFIALTAVASGKSKQDRGFFGFVKVVLRFVLPVSVFKGLDPVRPDRELERSTSA